MGPSTERDGAYADPSRITQPELPSELVPQPKRTSERNEPHRFARTTDPGPSKTAAVRGTPKRISDRDRLLELVRSSPGSTAHEYGSVLFNRRRLQLGHVSGAALYVEALRQAQTANKRMSDLLGLGLVEVIDDDTLCLVTGHKARRFRPTNPSPG